MLLRTLSRRLVILVDLLSVLSLVHAVALNLNPSGQGCVDPNGFLECFQAQENQAATCLATAKKTCSSSDQELAECVAGCDGAELAGNIGCWLQS